MCIKYWSLELVTCLPLWVSSLVLRLWWIRSLVVTCHSKRLLATYFYWLLVCLLSVWANKELVKYVLTCRPLENSVYKAHHPDDTDDPHAVGVSSEDEAEGMEDILGVTRRLNKPSPPEPPQPSPVVKARETDCELCHQSFKHTCSLCCHMKTHIGDTGWSCDQCGKVLASRIMWDLHVKSCGQEKGHWCQECNKSYTTKQALVEHLKVKHDPPPTVEELTCPICSKVFRIIKTMHEHMASHKGPFYCRVEGCYAGPFSLPKQLNRHMEEKHGFAARKE